MPPLAPTSPNPLPRPPDSDPDSGALRPFRLKIVASEEALPGACGAASACRAAAFAVGLKGYPGTTSKIVGRGAAAPAPAPGDVPCVGIIGETPILLAAAPVPCVGIIGETPI